MSSKTYSIAIPILVITLLTPLCAQEIPKTQRAISDVAAARLELDSNHLRPAVDLLEHANQLTPEWVVPHEWLAVAFQRAGDKERALVQYAWLQRKTSEFDLHGRTNPVGSVDMVISSEALTMWLVNDARQQHGLPVLRCEPQLSVVARGHSLEMRDLGYFAHESPTAGEVEPMDRFRNVFAFVPSCLRENIARRWGGDPCLNLDNIGITHQDFLKSPGHRANILADDIECFGVGVSTNSQGAYWLSEDFAQYQTAPSGDSAWSN